MVLQNSCVCVWFFRSKGTTVTLHPYFRILSDNTSNAPVVLAVIIRSAPACANFNAIAKPNPLEEPVTRAILFLNIFSYFFLSSNYTQLLFKTKL